MTAKKPNIFWICTDQQRYDTVGALGNAAIRTPQLDRLANNGLVFTNFYNCARCGPTRASMSTGLYSHQVGCYELEPVEPGNNVFLSELLGDHGYRTPKKRLPLVTAHPNDLPHLPLIQEAYRYRIYRLPLIQKLTATALYRYRSSESLPLPLFTVTAHPGLYRYRRLPLTA